MNYKFTESKCGKEQRGARVLSRIFAKKRQAPGQFWAQKDTEIRRCEVAFHNQCLKTMTKDEKMVRSLLSSSFDRFCFAGIFKLWVPGGAAACGREVEDRP